MEISDAGSFNEKFDSEHQESQLYIASVSSNSCELIFSTSSHIEAPNWFPDGNSLLFNSSGLLYRFDVSGRTLPQWIETNQDLYANNDHVISPDGQRIYFSVRGGYIYSIPVTGGVSTQVSLKIPSTEDHQCFLHGISPDGGTLVYVGISFVGSQKSYGIYAVSTNGGVPVTLIPPGLPVDGPEYSPDGQWIYYNSESEEREPGNSQVYRMKSDGTCREQLTRDSRVNWFPHVAPSGELVAFLSYPPGITGHPGNKNVLIRCMNANGSSTRDIASILGGQGSLNVNSWSPNSERFSFVAYPITRQ